MRAMPRKVSPLLVLATFLACTSAHQVSAPPRSSQPDAVATSSNPAPSSHASPTAAPASSPARASTASTAICVGSATPARWDHVIWIWMENHSYGQVIGSSAAPYENSLARGCGLATNYHGITHPSLPNYVAATGGSTAGITSDCSPGPSCESTGSSIFGQVTSSGRQWRAYEESMPSNCDLSSAGEYAVKHNPAPYYPAVRSQCKSWDEPFGTTSAGRFVSDLSAGRLPTFSFVTPNLCHDTHDCSVSTGDVWLKSVVVRITSSATYRLGRTAIVITWDEGFGSTNQVPTIIVAPSTKPGTRSATRFDHYSLLRTTEEMLGLAKIGHAIYEASMRAAFRL